MVILISDCGRMKELEVDIKYTGNDGQEGKKIQEPGKQKYFPEISLQLFKRPEDYICNTCVKHGNHQLCLKRMAG